jgi:hypothetical protein
MLDKSKGLTLGSELVTNGTFDTDLTGWVGYNSTPTWDASQRMLINAPTEFDGAKTPSSPLFTGLVAGKAYKISADIELGSAASAKIEFYSSTNALLARIDFPSSGSASAIFTATTVSGTIYVVSGSGSTGTFYADNISIRELPGNHATQSTSTARPTLQVTGTTPATLGSELVTNGTFDSSTTGWTGSSTTLSAQSGWLRAESVSTPAFAYQAISTVVGKVYTIAGEWRSSAGTWRIVVGTSAGNTNIYTSSIAGSGTVDATFTATTTTTYVSVRSVTITVGDYVEIDNVTVKEVLTWADPKYYLDFDGVDDYLQGPTHPFTFTGPVSFYAGFNPTSANTYSTLFSVGAGGSSGTNQDKTMAFQYSSTTLLGSGYRPSFATDIWRPAGVYAATTSPLALGTDYVAGFVIENWSTHRSSGTTSRINGAAQTVASYGSGVPTDLNASPTYIGVFDPAALSTSFANAKIYGLIALDRTLTTAEIEATESYLATKSGVTLP